LDASQLKELQTALKSFIKKTETLKLETKVSTQGNYLMQSFISRYPTKFFSQPTKSYNIIVVGLGVWKNVIVLSNEHGKLVGHLSFQGKKYLQLCVNVYHWLTSFATKDWA